ncbi:carbamoyltransferase [candidate division WOR-3 bacterium]|nr:carbamoyltransferase [candidate division WOR-3 bacterium]
MTGDSRLTTILGISAYHPDSSACIIRDGQLIAAAEEERFRRIKHWAGFSQKAIEYCLREADVSLPDVDYIAIGRNTRANLWRKGLFALKNKPGFNLVRDRLKNWGKIGDIGKTLSDEFEIDLNLIRKKIVNVEHHTAHIASTFLVSPFDKAALLSIDGFGDFVSTRWGIGEGSKMKIFGSVFYPYSLGLFYTALTQYLGFLKYGDEYKVMGLSSFGEPEFLDDFMDIVRLKKRGFNLNLDYFTHHKGNATMTWNNEAPDMENVYSEQLMMRFGPSRKYDEPITERHKNLAASLQRLTEEVIFKLLNDLYEETKCKRLCIAGGVGYNSVANGKIYDNTPFEEIYIQSASGDAGTSLGAAFYVYNTLLKKTRGFVMEDAYWGPEFSDKEIEREIIESIKGDPNGDFVVGKMKDDELCRKTAREIADGKIVGWFQGRMEWGPRALGNRSIVVDPRRKDMKDILNARIKKRESFRPFAPSILLERVGDYFEKSHPAPFMIRVFNIKEEKRDEIPAVTHIDGTGRLQTVRREDNPLYWSLIKEFENITGVPVVLNTSFNENEPIVCTPDEAIDCFKRTGMDILVMGNWVVSRRS